MSNSVTPRTTGWQIFPVLHYLPRFAKLMFFELVMPSNHLILCYPLLLLPSVFPSIMVFSNKSSLYIRLAKVWSFSFTSILQSLVSDKLEWEKFRFFLPHYVAYGILFSRQGIEPGPHWTAREFPNLEFKLKLLL